MPDETLRTLAEEYWETVLEASPSTATLLGDHRYDDRLEDLSAESEQRFRARWASLRERVEAVPRDGLDADDLVTFGLLTAELDDAMAWIDQRLVELQSDQMTGFHIELLQAVPVMAAPDEASANMLVERFRQVPRALEQAGERFVAGADAGRTSFSTTWRSSVRSHPSGPPTLTNTSSSSDDLRYPSIMWTERLTLTAAGVRPASAPATNRSAACSNARGTWRTRSTSMFADASSGAAMTGTAWRSSMWKPVIWSD